MREATTYDSVIVGGRVIDPETGLNAIRNVGITDRSIGAVSEGPREGRTVIDATGKIVAPGFINLNSHASTVAGHRLQAFDGVTTALGLEAGTAPIDVALRAAAEQGRPLNYGWSASWGMARMHELAGIPMTGEPEVSPAAVADPRWQVAASSEQVSRILGIIEEQLADGALGIGVILGYAKDTDPDEYLAVARLAASAGAPTYTHARDLIEVNPEVPIDGAEEIVRAAGETGAHMHQVHINASARFHIDRVHSLIQRATSEGSTVTLDAYPYGSGMTGIGAHFLAPDRLASRSMTPSSLVLLTGERIADAKRLVWLREHEPHHLVLVELVKDEEGLAEGGYLRRAMSFPGTVVASDAVYPVDTATGSIDTDAWPLPPTMKTHPRVCGTYSRSLRLLVDEVGMSWVDALERCTLGPARILETVAPAMRRKGRLQEGCDADVVVFDPQGLRDRATYLDPIVPSVGVTYLLVGGQAVIRDAELVVDARPGRPVIGQPDHNKASGL